MKTYKFFSSFSRLIAVELRGTCNVRSDVKVPWSNGRVDRQNSSNFAAEADFNYDKK